MPGDEPSRTVLDASVAVRWLVEERGSEQARALLELSTSWIAPRLLLTETAAALRRKVTEGELTLVQAAQALTSILAAISAGEIRLRRDEAVVLEALEIALLAGQKLPDCLYLALAEREGAGLATADRKLAEIAARRSVRLLAVEIG